MRSIVLEHHLINPPAVPRMVTAVAAVGSAAPAQSVGRHRRCLSETPPGLQVCQAAQLPVLIPPHQAPKTQVLIPASVQVADCQKQQLAHPEERAIRQRAAGRQRRQSHVDQPHEDHQNTSDVFLCSTTGSSPLGAHQSSRAASAVPQATPATTGTTKHQHRGKQRTTDTARHQQSHADQRPSQCSMENNTTSVAASSRPPLLASQLEAQGSVKTPRAQHASGPVRTVDAVRAQQKPVWAIAVDKRVAALQKSGAARHARLTRNTSPGSMGGAVAQPHSTAQGRSGLSLTAIPSVEQYLRGGELSIEGEHQLCLAYQRYVQLQHHLQPPQDPSGPAQPPAAEGLPRMSAEGYRDKPASPDDDDLHLPTMSTTGDEQLAAGHVMLQDPFIVLQEGLLAQELLLELYEPLIVSRCRKVMRASTDLRDLQAAARHGFLRAAARFDVQRARGRLLALAECYISMALRDALVEYQPTPVHVPTNVRALAMKLRRVEQQLQQRRGGKPALADVAAAAGVTQAQAESAQKAVRVGTQTASLQRNVVRETDDKGSKQGGNLELQELDVSLEDNRDDLGSVVGAGGLAAARSGLQEELDAAAERAAVGELLQNLLARLSPEDQDLLKAKLEDSSLSQIAQAAGRSREWGRQMVHKALLRLRQELQQHVQQDAEAADLLN